jgi:WD40 repeat protein
LAHGKDLGFLMNPGDGAIPCLEFFTPAPGMAATHLFSGSADGSISIWKVGGGWEHLKTMKGHKLGVNSISIHKTGRLALSVSRDSHLRMWNLAKGRCSYTAKLEVEGDDVQFSPSGEAYALTCGSKVTVHESSGEGSILGTLVHTRRVLCSAFGSPTAEGNCVLLTGVEDGSVKVWDLRTAACVHSMERMHESRVRGLVVVKGGSEGGMPEVFATASSDGVVKMWDSRKLGGDGSGAGGGRAVCLSQGSTGGARITCLTLARDRPLPEKKAVAAEKRSELDEDVEEKPSESKKKRKTAAKTEGES